MPISLEKITFETESGTPETFLDLDLNYPAPNLDLDLSLIHKRNELIIEKALPIKDFTFRNDITNALIEQKDIYFNKGKN